MDTVKHIYFRDNKTTFCGGQNTSAEIIEDRVYLALNDSCDLDVVVDGFASSYNPIELQGNLWALYSEWEALGHRHARYNTKQVRVCKECYGMYILHSIPVLE